MADNFQTIDKKIFGYYGKLYPNDMVIEVRGAQVAEIRKWSNIDENNVMSMSKHAFDIISACTRVTSTLPDKSYSAKDLYEHDKFALLLLIQDATFPSNENGVFVSGDCTNVSCKHHYDRLRIMPQNLTYVIPDEQYEKYIDHDLGVFVLDTKRFGKIVYKPSTFGLGNAMMSWMQTFQTSFIEENQTMFPLIQALVSDWRAANDKLFRHLQISEYNMWDAAKLAFYTSLIDKLSIKMNQEVEFPCEQCGATFRTPIRFEQGYKSLFIPVQSFDDELL